MSSLKIICKFIVMAKLNKRKCAYCQMTFQKIKPLQNVCGSNCAIEWAKVLREKKERNEWQKEKKKRIEKLKTKSDYEKELQVPINKIARLIDKGSNCMMCDNVMKRTNGCHYHSRGSSPTLRFNLLNIWIGCHKCNSELGGNIIGFDNRLIDVYDRDKWEFIKFDIVRDIQPLHLTVEDLAKAKIEANKIVRELEKLDMIYSPIVRWTMREKYNKRIGIYT